AVAVQAVGHDGGREQRAEPVSERADRARGTGTIRAEPGEQQRAPRAGESIKHRIDLGGVNLGGHGYGTGSPAHGAHVGHGVVGHGTVDHGTVDHGGFGHGVVGHG